MRNLTCILIGIGILTAAALADPRQDRIDEARRALDEAQDRLRAAERRADRARDNRDNAIRDKARFEQELATVNQDEGELTRLLSTVETEARTAKDARDLLRRESNVKANRVKATEKTVVEAEQGIVEAKKKAEVEFLATDESRSRLAAIESATATLAAERKRVVDALAETASYKSLRQTADKTEAAVTAARDATPTNPAELARASQAWIDAKSSLEAAERQACERDKGYAEAAARLEEAKSAHKSALEAFRASSDQLPEVLAQAKRRESAFAEHADARRDLAAASTGLKSAEVELKSRVDRYNETNARLTSARAARDKLAAQALDATRAIQAADADIANADRDIARAARDVADARRRLAQAQRG